jgi:hypothetical protein
MPGLFLFRAYGSPSQREVSMLIDVVVWWCELLGIGGRDIVISAVGTVAGGLLLIFGWGAILLIVRLARIFFAR